MYDQGNYHQAITWLDQLVTGYPDDPNASEAQETLASAREEQDRIDAENAERLEEEQAAEEEERRTEDIQDMIDQTIDEGDWDIFDEPDLLGSTGDDSATLTISNSSVYDLEVLYIGPEEAPEEEKEAGYYSLDACGHCTADCSDPASGTLTVTLPPGVYDVIIRSAGDSVTPIWGAWGLDAGNEYGACVYVSP
jgi:hypothetical protein